MTNQHLLEKLKDNICLSGGAEGADLQFGMVSGSIGYSVIHWSFPGHKSNAPTQEIVVLSEEQLKIADEFCLKANEYLKRKYPPADNYTRNLLRRNYFQIAWSNSVYAISTIKDNMVEGGTAWAIAMFLDKFEYKSCDCYVFCQEVGYWFKWDGEWKKIYEPPTPKNIFAGIGTRKLNFNGKLAIRTLMNYENCRRFDHMNRQQFNK